MKGPIQIPDFNRIIEHACLILVQNANTKGNSWVEMDNDSFWVAKLKEELKEVIDRIKNDDDAEYIQKELIDLINIAAMLYTSMDER